MRSGNHSSALGALVTRVYFESEIKRALVSTASHNGKHGPDAWPEPQLAQRNRPMTLTEAADHLRISTRQLHRLRKLELIRDCRRIGKRGTVNRSDVLRIASASPRKGA
jgi:hypothetical protein